MPLMDEMKTSHAPSFTVGGIEPTAPREVQEEEAEEAEGRRKRVENCNRASEIILLYVVRWNIGFLRLVEEKREGGERKKREGVGYRNEARRKNRRLWLRTTVGSLKGR